MSGASPARRGLTLHVTPLRRVAFFVAIDLALVVTAVVASALLRFEGRPPPGSAPLYLLDGLAVGALMSGASWAVGTYRASWAFFGLRDIGRVAAAVAIATAGSILGILALRGAGVVVTPSLAVHLIQAPLSFCLVSGFRLSKRAARVLLRVGAEPAAREPTLIVGAGAAGEQVLKSILESPKPGPRVVGFVDDDPLARGTSIHGVRVLGPVADLGAHIERTGAKLVIISIATANSALVQEIVRTSRRLGVAHVRIVPTLAELVGGSASFGATREVTMEDLLGRDPVRIDMEGVRHALADRRVVVTGGAGTIGAELCRQIARFGPRRLVVVDVDETRIHDLALELHESFPQVPVVQGLVDVRDRGGLDRLFAATGADVVFHAAAYKHVPMMELWPVAALDVNVLGTANVLDAASDHGCERFVLISTDKAVEPSSVMGASKRLAELVLFGARARPARVAAVRFGNVLGSRGSVLPTFERQLKHGGPLTVTHPEVERYFMMTSEAVQLVLQAAVMASEKDVFVLDMGKPVRILDVAREFIRLHGREPDTDVPIVFTGLRPGEKLSEVLRYEHEELEPTPHPRISKVRVHVAHESSHVLESARDLVIARDEADAKAFLRKHFPSLDAAAETPARPPA